MTTKSFRSVLFVGSVLLALTACASRPSLVPPMGNTAATIDWSQAPTQTVRMTDFEFTPDHLTLRVGAPVRLMLVNEGSDTHAFSAPKLFAASAFRAGGTPPADSNITVDKAQTKELDLVPNSPGTYPVECTEFLHAMFGMTGVIEVEP